MSAGRVASGETTADPQGARPGFLIGASFHRATTYLLQ